MADLTLDIRLHLGSVRVAVVEANALELEVASETLLGLGVRRLGRFRTAADAQDGLRRDPADMVVVGSVPGDPDEYALIRWLRRDGPEPLRKVPVLLLTGHTQQANVIRARDCGASVVLAKPVQPLALFERVGWLSRDQRPFVMVPSYAGPDRRFQKLGPPAGMAGRRADDPLPNAGGTKEASMSEGRTETPLPAGAS